jgi:NAD/NADP transhydrogenase beta subunit
MDVYLAFLIIIVIITFVSLFIYRFGRNKSKRLTKYIPSIASALSIALIYLKMTFISEGYQPILDIVIMIIISFVLGVSLLIAVVTDLLNNRNKNRINL